MFNIKPSITLFLFLSYFCFFSLLKTEAQDFANQGEGEIIVEQFLSFDQSPDFSKPYQMYTFYVINFLVLREEPKIPELPINFDSLGHSIPIHDENGNEGGSVSSSMAVSIRQTNYLLDLKSKTAFVFGHKNGKIYYYKTEMKDFGEDMYRFFSKISAFSDYEKIEFTKNSKPIAGKICEEGLLSLKTKKLNKDTVKATFWFTKDKISLKTPLDNMFNEASPFSVFMVSYPTAKGSEGLPGYFTSVIKEIKEEKIPDEKFEIPTDAILLTKTDWENYGFDH